MPTVPDIKANPDMKTYIPRTPEEIIAPGCGSPSLLTRSQARGVASRADLAPQAPRPDSLRGLDCPSRVNNRLYHRDGRVTDLDSQPIKPTRDSA